MSDDLRSKTDFVLEVIKRYDGYIATTNFKVGLLLSFVVATVFGIGLRVLSLSLSDTSCIVLYWAIVASSTITVIFSLIAAIYLLRVVFPNTSTHDGRKSLIFFGDVSSCEGGIDGYVEKVKESSDADIFDDWARQAFVVSEIATQKFAMLKSAISVLKVAVILLIISVVFIILWEISAHV